MCVAGEYKSSQTPGQDGASSLQEERQIRVWEWGYRKLRGEMNFPKDCCCIYLGTEGDPSTGHAQVRCSPAAPEQAWFGDSNIFCQLPSDPQARWDVKWDPGPSKKTNQEQ